MREAGARANRRALDRCDDRRLGVEEARGLGVELGGAVGRDGLGRACAGEIGAGGKQGGRFVACRPRGIATTGGRR